MGTQDTTDIERIVQRIIETDQALKRLISRDPTRRQIAAGTPATSADIQKLKASGQYSITPSYERLLAIHDGIKNFYWTSGDLLSVRDLLENPGYADDYELPHMFLFVIGPDWVSVGFDMNSPSKDAGELEVVEFDKTGELFRWQSLTAFLQGYLARLEDWLSKARADRAQSDDD